VNGLAFITGMLQEEADTDDGTSTKQRDDKDWISACAEKCPSEAPLALH